MEITKEKPHDDAENTEIACEGKSGELEGMGGKWLQSRCEECARDDKDSDGVAAHDSAGRGGGRDVRPAEDTKGSKA